MKKILIVHNKYREVGGEDIAVENEINLLQSSHKVETLIFENDIRNYFMQFFYFLINRNFKSEKELIKKLENFNPDIVYVHNTWFKASLGIFKILENKKIKTIVKLHNFRYFCTKDWLRTNHLNNKSFCDACGLDKNRSLFFNKYFHDSVIKSIFMIIYGKLYFKYLKSGKCKILVLTNFHKQFLKDLDFDEKNIFVQRNYISNSLQLIENVESNYIVYAGRISKEKGVEELLSSFLKSNNKNLDLKIIGDGPELIFLKEKFKNKKVEFLGMLKNRDVVDLIQKSKAVVTVTKLYEGQPTILTEASILGIPSVFPDFGGMSEFFPEDYPLKFEQFKYDDLINKFNLLENNLDLNKLGDDNKKYINVMLDKEKILENFNKIIDE